MRSFSFYWQNVEDQYLGPGFVLLSQQQRSKFDKQKNRNIAIFATLKSLIINRR